MYNERRRKEKRRRKRLEERKARKQSDNANTNKTRMGDYRLGGYLEHGPKATLDLGQIGCFQRISGFHGRWNHHRHGRLLMLRRKRRSGDMNREMRIRLFTKSWHGQRTGSRSITKTRTTVHLDTWTTIIVSVIETPFKQMHSIESIMIINQLPLVGSGCHTNTLMLLLLLHLLGLLTTLLWTTATMIGIIRWLTAAAARSGTTAGRKLGNRVISQGLLDTTTTRWLVGRWLLWCRHGGILLLLLLLLLLDGLSRWGFRSLGGLSLLMLLRLGMLGFLFLVTGLLLWRLWSTSSGDSSVRGSVVVVSCKCGFVGHGR